MDNADTIGILRQLERGEINASQADERLNQPQAERIDAAPIDERAKFALPNWMRWVWTTPLALGTLIVIFGAWIIAATARTNLLWFLIGIPTVLFGSLLIVIGASVFNGHWIYINVEGSRRKHSNIRFGIPFPIGLIRLALWIAPWAFKMSDNHVRINHGKFNFHGEWDDPVAALAAFEHELKEGRGITIDVDDKNERVQVYIV